MKWRIKEVAEEIRETAENPACAPQDVWALYQQHADALMASFFGEQAADGGMALSPAAEAVSRLMEELPDAPADAHGVTVLMEAGRLPHIEAHGTQGMTVLFDVSLLPDDDADAKERRMALEALLGEARADEEATAAFAAALKDALAARYGLPVRFL